MKIFATAALAVLALCAPAVADPAQPPPTQFKIRFTMRDATTQVVDVMVSTASPCATATRKRPDHEFELRACATHDLRLDLDWASRGAGGEYRSSSSMLLAHGATAELGSERGPHLTVAIQ